LSRVLSKDIWSEISKQARTKTPRKIAISYVTTDHIGLRAGDVLITDASEKAIRTNQTDAKLLRELHGNGVTIHSHKGLHSKVLLLGRHAIVGSANMSGSGLIEASVVTDDPSVVSGVASFIAQLSTKRSKLDDDSIRKLCEIEVIRSGWPERKSPKPKPIRKLGNSTWIVGVNELKRDPTTKEQKHIDRANERLNAQSGGEEDYDWIRWGKKSKFSKECREGDTLIRIWNPRGAGRSRVTRRLALLLKGHEPTYVRLYIDFPRSDADEIGWSRFQRILRASGYTRRVGKHSVQRLDPEIAADIDRKWPRVR
jgi:hypothetical protein